MQMRMIPVMLMHGVGMAVMTVFAGGRDQMQRTVPHSGLGDGRVGELPHLLAVSLQQHDLETILVIQMNMQGREHQVVMGMLGVGQAAGQFALMVVVDIAQTSDRMLRFGLLQTFRLEALAEKVPNRLRTVLISFPPDIAVEFLQKPFVQRNRHPFHLVTFSIAADPASPF